MISDSIGVNICERKYIWQMAFVNLCTNTEPYAKFPAPYDCTLKYDCTEHTAQSTRSAIR